MALNFNLELLIEKYIQSATKGEKITVKLRKILTLVVLPILLLVVFWSGIMSYKGIIAVIQTKKIEESIRLEGIKTKPYNPNQEMINYEDPHVKELKQSLFIQKDRKNLVYYLPLCLLIFFILPWIVIRLVY